MKMKQGVITIVGLWGMECLFCLDIALLLSSSSLFFYSIQVSFVKSGKELYLLLLCGGV